MHSKYFSRIIHFNKELRLKCFFLKDPVHVYRDYRKGKNFDYLTKEDPHKYDLNVANYVALWCWPLNVLFNNYRSHHIDENFDFYIIEVPLYIYHKMLICNNKFNSLKDNMVFTFNDGKIVRCDHHEVGTYTLEQYNELEELEFVYYRKLTCKSKVFFEENYFCQECKNQSLIEYNNTYIKCKYCNKETYE